MAKALNMSEKERLAWFLSVLKTLGDLNCAVCHAYLNGISRFSWLPLSSDGDSGLKRQGELYALELELHSSSPLFPEVFAVSGTISDGRYQGRCRSCGREYRYIYQAKGGSPGRLFIGAKAEPGLLPKPSEPSPEPVSSPVRQAGRPPQPSSSSSKGELSSAPKKVFLKGSSSPMEFSPERLAEHERLLAGPPLRSDWARQLKHRWTANFNLSRAFFQDFIPTPQVVWFEVDSQHSYRRQLDALGLTRESGEVVFHSRGSRLLSIQPHLRPMCQEPAHGRLTRREGGIDSYDKSGKLTASWKGDEEMLSFGPRYCVGSRPMGPGGLWGCAEPELRVTARHTGETRTLPANLFVNRTCYLVSGDILWCVCENQTILRGYNLHSRKVVREISPLPDELRSNHRDGKIQFLSAYGTDIYLASSAGFVAVFGASHPPED